MTGRAKTGGKTGGKAGKARRRSAKSRRMGNRKPASSDLQKQLHEQAHALAEARRQLAEALEQQTATSEVLKVISSSPGELQPVFDAMLANATRLCGAKFGALYLRENEGFRIVSIHGAPSAFVEERRRNPLIDPARNTVMGKMAATKRPAQIADIREEAIPGARSGTSGVNLAALAGARSVVAVPMVKDDELAGGILIFRQEVRPFTEKQIELVQNFAAQAVIAIENARLLNELRQRTDDLTESLEQQTATSEVLKVISSSPGELQPVFQAMLANAVRICEAKFGVLHRFEKGLFHPVAMQDIPAALAEYARQQRGGVVPLAGSSLERLMRSKAVVHNADELAEQVPGAPARLAGARTLLAVPMLKESELIGGFIIYRQEVRPFTDKQIELVKNFAAQAVIAIENSRLLNELRQRTDDLTESLEQQTATSELLRVIASSPTDLQPVLDAVAETAARMCGAHDSVMRRVDGDALRLIAHYGTIPSQDTGDTTPLSRSTVLGRAVVDRRTIHVRDMLEEPEHEFPMGQVLQQRFGFRTMLATPLLREGVPTGGILIRRTEVRPFTDSQIKLLETFASQAVIAIENTRLFQEVQERTRELTESLEQQTATSEVLKVISSSPGELAPVFNAMLENAVRICGAQYGMLALGKGEEFTSVAVHGMEPALVGKLLGKPRRPGPNTAAGRVARTKQPVHISDVQTEPGFFETPPGFDGPQLALLASARTLLAVPLLKEGELAGYIVIYRKEPQPFTQKHIELVQNFAAQAVIAIENTRLLNELRQRTDDLTESLEQQTATSEVLKVISSSPGSLEPVFRAMLENAVRICGAEFGVTSLREGDAFRVIATTRLTPPALIEQRQREPLVRPTPGHNLERLLRTKAVVHVPDIPADPGSAPTLAKFGSAKALLNAPLLKDNELIGSIVIFRQEVGPFTAKQIELVQNFAAQAVIAIENTRLLNELRESLQQQTATADVLKVISNSPGELEPVFAAMLENAVRICDAKFGVMFRFDGEVSYPVATLNLPPVYEEYLRNRGRRKPMPGSDLDVLRRSKRVIHTLDMLESSRHAPPAKLAGGRTKLAVPMLMEDELIGAIVIYRQEVRPFSDKQTELVQNFAAQAVIAIENTRLLNELRESLQQQTATADVLKVISRSTFDLQTVLDTLTASAARLCRAERSAIRLLRGDLYHNVASHGFLPEHKERMEREPVKPGPGSMVGRVAVEHKSVHLIDAQLDPDPQVANRSRSGNTHTMLGVPLLRERAPIGVLLLQRSVVQPFTDKEIVLAETFADQAVIAIENVRLFEEIQDKSRQLAEASQHKSQFLANMSHELRTPLNAILGYTELISDGVYGEPTEKMLGVLKRLESNGRHLLGLINDVLDLSKIEAGQLKLDLSEYSLETIVQTVHSAVEPLAADKKLRFRTEVATGFPKGHGDERRLTQVLLNLVGNAIKFTDAGEVIITADAGNGNFNLSVRDTGPGISAADQAKLFQEFQQADNSITRKKGGTGLGLAISKQIIEMHGGRIWVDSVVGQGSTFSLTLPVRVERQVEVG